jgi:signal transduction histidine kinase
MAHKLEAVGQLAAGIAHEINTPIQYVADSISFLGEAITELQGYVAAYRGALSEGKLPDPIDAAADLAYLDEHAPAALARARAGLDRVATVVRAMKDFGQPAQHDKAWCDLNRALETTLTVATAAYRHVADIELELGELPVVACHVAELNQVFLHLIVNAAYAIGEARVAPARGTIWIKTWTEPSHVLISIADDGTGIPEAIQSRVFDPFFTTKPVGAGTGQGLAIARSIVVDRHAGTLTFETAVGRGSTFVVRLPRG